MGVSTIDGTIESIVAGRQTKKVSVFKSIVFRKQDGSSRTVEKAVVSGDVAAQIAPGNSGRFYLFTGFDMKGVHAVRKADGTAVYAFPGKGNAIIFMILVPINLAWIALRIIDKGDVPLLGVGLVILGAVGWYLMSKTGQETRAQFDADAAWTGQEGGS
jgi:hypothetical protein